jgi:hypothetical protein
MWNNYGTLQRDQRTEQERYLEDQVDEYKRRDEERSDREYREREQRRHEREERWEAARREADDWKESLEKQVGLCGRELRIEELDCEKYGGTPEPEETSYFAQIKKGCERGLQLWEEIETNKKPEIDKLLAQIEALKNQIRFDVADRLEKEHSSDGWNPERKRLREKSCQNVRLPGAAFFARLCLPFLPLTR